MLAAGPAHLEQSLPELAACAMQPNRQRIDCQPKGGGCRNSVLGLQVDPADHLRIFRVERRQDQVNALARRGLALVANRFRRTLLQQKVVLIAAAECLAALVINNSRRDDAAEPAMDGTFIAKRFGFLHRAKNDTMQNILGVGRISKPADKVSSQTIIAPR